MGSFNGTNQPCHNTCGGICIPFNQSGRFQGNKAQQTFRFDIFFFPPPLRTCCPPSASSQMPCRRSSQLIPPLREVTAKYSFLTPVQTVMGLARPRRDTTRQSSAPASPSSSNVTPFHLLLLLCLFTPPPAADASRSTPDSVPAARRACVRSVEVDGASF